MKTCYYDFYYNSPPKFLRTDIIDPTQPFLIFFPAFTHPDLYDIFSGEFKVLKQSIYKKL